MIVLRGLLCQSSLQPPFRMLRIVPSLRRSLSSTTSLRRKDYAGILAAHWSPAVPRSPKGNNIVVERAKGCYIYSDDGKRYLDMQVGIGVANTGHCHDR